MQFEDDELDNSRPLDVHKWSEYPEVNQAVNHIYSEFVALDKIKDDDDEKFKKHLKVVILDLYVCYLSDPVKFIGYPRNNNKLENDRYNQLFINVRQLRKVVDWLDELGYLVKWTPTPGKRGRQSRMRATLELNRPGIVGDSKL